MCCATKTQCHVFSTLQFCFFFPHNSKAQEIGDNSKECREQALQEAVDHLRGEHVSVGQMASGRGA